MSEALILKSNFEKELQIDRERANNAFGLASEHLKELVVQLKM